MRKQSGFRFIDLFAGIGGFHLGLKESGGECVFACEFDGNARKTYSANYDVPHFAHDIADVRGNDIPDYEILCAGFPCQPFSISGRHKAFSDERASTVFQLFRLIRETKPKAVILENVKHILHVAQGSVFRTIHNDLSALGYSVDWALLNAKDFGVPQNRERVVIVASQSDFRFPNFKKTNGELKLRDFLDKKNDFEYMQEPFTIITNPTRQKSGLLFVGYRNKTIRKKGVRPGTEHLSRVHKQPNRIYSIDGIHPTIPSQESSGRFWIMLDDGRVRKMTIDECFRIMGFPDSFRKPVPKGVLFQQIGNAVCIPKVQAVCKEVIKQTRIVA